MKVLDDQIEMTQEDIDNTILQIETTGHNAEKNRKTLSAENRDEQWRCLSAACARWRVRQLSYLSQIDAKFFRLLARINDVGRDHELTAAQ
jgi:hypothetical protein